VRWSAQENILRRVEAEDEELQSLVERIYDTSFPESQVSPAALHPIIRSFFASGV
jgi:hypothetical protein